MTICLLLFMGQARPKYINKASNNGINPSRILLGVLAMEEKKYEQALNIFKSITKEITEKNITANVESDKNTKHLAYSNRIYQFKRKKIEGTLYMYVTVCFLFI